MVATMHARVSGIAALIILLFVCAIAFYAPFFALFTLEFGSLVDRPVHRQAVCTISAAQHSIPFTTSQLLFVTNDRRYYDDVLDVHS